MFPKNPPKVKKSSLASTSQGYRDIVMHAPIGIATSTPEGALLGANPALAGMLGYATLEEFVDSIDNIAKQLYADNNDREEFKRLLKESGKVANYECRLVCKDTSLLWVSMNARTVKDKQGKIRHYQSFFSDITKRKQSESQREAAFSELRSATIYYRSLFESCLDPLISVAPDGMITDANKAAEETFGHSREDIIGTQFSDYFAEPEKAQSLCDMVLRKKTVRNYTFYLNDRHGSAVIMIYNLSPYHDEHGNIVGILATARDITEHMEMERQLEYYADGLEELVRKRTEELEGKRQALEEMNAALNVLLQKRDEDKRELEKQFVSNIRELVIPYVEKIKPGLFEDRQRACLDIIEKNLDEVVSPFLNKLYQHKLTPREAQVAALVKSGKTTKEIAEIVGLAAGSVDLHRKNIRKKLRISRTTNLQSYLSLLG